jgi:predicted nucleic acid-binding protein
VAGYLLDTSVLIALVDSQSPFSRAANDAMASMQSSDLQFVSSISFGEIHTGIEANFRIRGQRPPNAQHTLALARTHSLLVVDEHVAHTYGGLKAAMVVRYMPNASRSQRGQFLENWINQATGLRLGINENDIWICAQALERDIFVISTDSDFERVREAEPRLKLLSLAPNVS